MVAAGSTAHNLLWTVEPTSFTWLWSIYARSTAAKQVRADFRAQTGEWWIEWSNQIARFNSFDKKRNLTLCSFDQIRRFIHLLTHKLKHEITNSESGFYPLEREIH